MSVTFNRLSREEHKTHRSTDKETEPDSQEPPSESQHAGTPFPVSALAVLRLPTEPVQREDIWFLVPRSPIHGLNSKFGNQYKFDYVVK